MVSRDTRMADREEVVAGDGAEGLVASIVHFSLGNRPNSFSPLDWQSECSGPAFARSAQPGRRRNN